MKATHKILAVSNEDEFFKQASQFRGRVGTFDLDYDWDKQGVYPNRGLVSGTFTFKNPPPHLNGKSNCYFHAIKVKEL